MSAESALERGRRFAESIMPTACIIRRATGETVEDPGTFEETPVMADVYIGQCQIIMGGGEPSTAAVPGAVATDQTTTLMLPVGALGAADVTTDDVWECTANPADPTLVGRRAAVTGIHQQTYSTRYAYPMEVPS